MRKALATIILPCVIAMLLLVRGFSITSSQQKPVWWASLTTSIGSIFLAVSITEVLIEIVKRRIKESHQHAFEHFFGVDIHHDPGKIVLQADRMDGLLKERLYWPYGPDPLDGTRLFKARRWINAHDVEGAAEIREAFWKVGSRPPELLLESEERTYTYGTSPCLICMGLGFTSETQRIIGEVGAGWLKAPKSTNKGDAVELHESVFPFKYRRFFETDNRADSDGFIRLDPRDWDPAEYPKVRDEHSDRIEASSRDYAIILRYTQMKHADGPGQSAMPRTWFVVAGFTAHGTAAAGKFLAVHWEDLWKKYVRKEPKSLGDFCQIIVGQSEYFNKTDKAEAPDDFGTWQPVDDLDLTPKGLKKAGINSCEWALRLAAHQRATKTVRQLLHELRIAAGGKISGR